MSVVVSIDSRLFTRRRDPQFVSTANDRWTPPIWPAASDNAEYGRIWDDVERPEKRPLARWKGDGLHRVDLEFQVWRDGQSVEPDLQAVRKLTGNGYPVRIDGAGPSHLGWWHVERPTWPILQANERLEATHAVVRMSLRRAETLATITPIAAAAPGETSGLEKRAPSTPTIVADGRPLPVAAFQVYGDASRWPEIADYNGITNPAAITVGTVLRMPA